MQITETKYFSASRTERKLYVCNYMCLLWISQNARATPFGYFNFELYVTVIYIRVSSFAYLFFFTLKKYRYTLRTT